MKGDSHKHTLEGKNERMNEGRLILMLISVESIGKLFSIII